MADEPKPKTRSALKAGERIANLKRLARDRKAEAARLSKEVEDLKARPSTEDLAKKVKDYQDKERTAKHRKSFDEAAKKAKVKPEALDDLWELAKLDTSADEPDPKAIETAVGEKVKARPYLVGTEEPAPKPGSTGKPPLNPGPNANRGERSNNGGFTATKQQISDPQWMSAHQAEYAASTAAGTFFLDQG
jgi:hypothetical protein